MRYVAVFLSVICMNVLFGQLTTDLEKRFTTYLNFNGSLTSLVSFKEHSVSIMNSGKNEFTVYENEYTALADLLWRIMVKNRLNGFIRRRIVIITQ